MGGGGAERATALGWWLRLFAWPHLRHPLLLELKQEAEASVLKSGASPGHRDQPAVAASLHRSLCVVLPLPLSGAHCRKQRVEVATPSRLDIRGEWGGGATNSLSQAFSPSAHLGFYLSNGSTHSFSLSTLWDWAWGRQHPEVGLPSTKWSHSQDRPCPLRAGCRQRSLGQDSCPQSLTGGRRIRTGRGKTGN